jgi:hypothetical protein
MHMALATPIFSNATGLVPPGVECILALDDFVRG